MRVKFIKNEELKIRNEFCSSSFLTQLPGVGFFQTVSH
jgi:hypothetical protein